MSIPYRRDSLRRLTVTLDIASAEVQSNTTSDYVILTHKVRSLLQKKAVRARKASNCGPFSLVFCGDSGIGKTSLIHAFTESEDFVKMDSPHSHVIPDSTNTIQEIMASTIPHMSLAYGEKQENITFVDTPGFGSFMDAMTVIQPCIEYLIQKFRETDTIFTKKTSSARLNQLFKQAGLGHVDVCLYCILHRVKSVDLEFMRVLAGHVSLVPLIVKSDTMTLEEVFALKLNILEQLSCANIPIYGFGLGEGELMSLARSKVGGGVPFAVSTKGVDGKIAFGGECMNEIVLLRKQLFCNHVADFRALGAERFVSWRTRYQS
ncbi:Septin-domain-containing protein [Chytriomyces sp. MP71]|nr:Septin-domain-containing protein [Chytriomyces sp. MP71]